MTLLCLIGIIVGLCMILLGCLLERKHVNVVETKVLPPPGVIICASGSKPHHAPRGMCAWESDTNTLWWFNGRDWEEISPAKYYKRSN